MAKLEKFLVNNSGGLVKNEKQAGIFLLLVVVILLVISIMLILSAGEGKQIKGTEYNPNTGYGGRELPDHYR